MNISKNKYLIVYYKIIIRFESSTEEFNLARLVSKKVAESLKSKTLTIYNKLIIVDPDANKRILLIEMELAKYSLRELIT